MTRSFWGTQRWTLWVLLQFSHAMVQSAALAYLPAKSQLNSTRQEGAGSCPLPHITTTFPWIILCWPHPYTPKGGSFSIPKACLSWTSLLTDGGQHHACILHTQKDSVPCLWLCLQICSQCSTQVYT